MFLLRCSLTSFAFAVLSFFFDVVFRLYLSIVLSMRVVNISYLVRVVLSVLPALYNTGTVW
jgi:hypothetical protein